MNVQISCIFLPLCSAANFLILGLPVLCYPLLTFGDAFGDVGGLAVQLGYLVLESLNLCSEFAAELVDLVKFRIDLLQVIEGFQFAFRNGCLLFVDCLFG